MPADERTKRILKDWSKSMARSNTPPLSISNRACDLANQALMEAFHEARKAEEKVEGSGGYAAHIVADAVEAFEQGFSNACIKVQEELEDNGLEGISDDFARQKKVFKKFSSKDAPLRTMAWLLMSYIDVSVANEMQSHMCIDHKDEASCKATEESGPSHTDHVNLLVKLFAGQNVREISAFNKCIGDALRGKKFSAPLPGMGGRHNKQIHDAFRAAVKSCARLSKKSR
jgi:hypothetical protein